VFRVGEGPKVSLGFSGGHSGSVFLAFSKGGSALARWGTPLASLPEGQRQKPFIGALYQDPPGQQRSVRVRARQGADFLLWRRVICW
jgi:hypothetical protein